MVLILCPLLFSMHVNDLPNVCTPDVICQMYADDVVLYVHAKSQQQAAQKLTDTMNQVAKWIINFINYQFFVCFY